MEVALTDNVMAVSSLNECAVDNEDEVKVTGVAVVNKLNHAVGVTVSMKQQVSNILTSIFSSLVKNVVHYLIQFFAIKLNLAKTVNILYGDGLVDFLNDHLFHSFLFNNS